MKGNLKHDVNRMKQMKGRAQQKAGMAGAKGKQVSAAAGKVSGGASGGSERAGIRKEGFFSKKHICNVCNKTLDKTWDACPFCADASQSRTQAFIVDHSGAGMQLLGWLVPVAGPLKGELFALSPASSVGTDADCHVVLIDPYMSGKHAEINVEAGIWVLKDLGSTNGTFVNDKRIDKRELVDNDFIKFGNSLVKFKSI